MSDFQVVRRKKGRKSRILTKSFQQLDITDGDDFDKVKCKKQINTYKEELAESKFWLDFNSLLYHTTACRKQSCQSTDNCEVPASFEEIIVYGIGSLCSSSIARYQFGFLLLLAEKIRVNCFLYDPVLTQNEKILIMEYGIKLIDENEECKRNVHKKTLFVMLHCGKAMYNNLLWCNWGLPLQNIWLIGNCFSSYEERIPFGELAQSSYYLKEVIPFTVEHKLKNTFHRDDVFNDTAIHTFPIELLLKASNDIWAFNEEPSSDHCDIEIIINK